MHTADVTPDGQLMGASWSRRLPSLAIAHGAAWSATPFACQASRRRCILLPLSSLRGEDRHADVKKQLATWIDDDRDKIIEFLCEFVRAKSPNRRRHHLAAAHVTISRSERSALSRDAPSRPCEHVGAFDTGKPGHHLVLNGT